MKMSEILNTLTKETLVKMISNAYDSYHNCSYCPLRDECRKASAEGDDRNCEEFLNDMIEEDRGE